MAKFYFQLDTGFAGCEHEDEVEIDVEGMSEQEIQETVENEWKDWVWNKIQGCWKKTE